MPIERTSEGQPVVRFEPGFEISPFTLFRRLSEGRSPALYDIRDDPKGWTLRGARPIPRGWQPSADEEAVLFDDDGSRAPALARALHETGAVRVRALFGGLELYAFALDPEIVGAETYLDQVPPGNPDCGAHDQPPHGTEAGGE